MTELDAGRDLIERQRILDVALAELTAKDVGGFTLEGVAARAGVEPQAVRRFWASTPEIYTAALVGWGDQHMPVPDTGTLRGDFREYARSFAEAVNSPIGRRILDAVVVSAKDWDLSGSREAFRQARPNRPIAMVQRAIDRGECAAGTDPELLTDLLGASLCIPVLFHGQPISQEHADRVVELVLSGALRR